MSETLNPGSDEAVEAGCRCARMDNGYGRGYMGGAKDSDGNTLFVVSGDCPLHGRGLGGDDEAPE